MLRELEVVSSHVLLEEIYSELLIIKRMNSIARYQKIPTDIPFSEIEKIYLNQKMMPEQARSIELLSEVLTDAQQIVLFYIITNPVGYILTWLIDEVELAIKKALKRSN